MSVVLRSRNSSNPSHSRVEIMEVEFVPLPFAVVEISNIYEKRYAVRCRCPVTRQDSTDSFSQGGSLRAPITIASRFKPPRSAMSRVLPIPELLEEILLLLPARDLMRVTTPVRYSKIASQDHLDCRRKSSGCAQRKRL